MTEIEKVVARALTIHDGDDPDRDTGIAGTPALWMVNADSARAVLAALREAGYAVIKAHEDPTPAMLDRGVAMHRTHRSGDDETLVHDIWQAMWDAMMTEVNDG